MVRLSSASRIFVAMLKGGHSKSYTSSDAVSIKNSRRPPVVASESPGDSGFRAPNGSEVTPAGPAAECLRESPGGHDDLRQRDPRLDPEAIQEIQDVFGRHVAGGPRSVWATAEASGGGVEGRNPAFEPGGDVGERRAPRVVKVKRQDASRDAGFIERFHDLVDSRGRRDPDGVAQGDLVDGQVEELVNDLPHGVGGDGALVGAAERGRNVSANPDFLLLRASDDGPEPLDGLVDARVEVVLVEGLGRGGEDRDLPHPRRHGAFQPAEVRHERGIARAAPAMNATEALLRS